MERALSPIEAQVLQNLMEWDRRSSGGERLLGHLLLLLGGLIIVAAAGFTLCHPSDDVIFGVVVPGFVVGLAVIGLALGVARRARERHLLASVIRKLRGGAQA